MSIGLQILGNPDRDNALWVQIDTGQSITRLLFDCGDGCLTGVPYGEIQAIDHLFFSHLHMDHVSGFDAFFRCVFNRDAKPNQVWGPPETARILQHRFQGFLWNLHEQMSATWRVSDINEGHVHTSRFELGEAFAIMRDEGARSYERTILDGPGFLVEAIILDHKTPSAGYIVREKLRQNIDPSRLAALGLRPGPWLKGFKETSSGATIVIEGVAHSADQLRRELLVDTPGDSVAYLTDFWLDERELDRLAEWLNGCRKIVCEAQYRHSDLELAQKHYHLTASLSATLAQRANAEELILFHLSNRYDRAGWAEILREAQAVFPHTRYPKHWGIA
jgi:ribonuclease Z